MSSFMDPSINKYLSYFRVNLMVSAYGIVADDWKEKPLALSHDKIYYIEKGEGVLYINGEAYYPKPGDLVMIPKGSIHGYSTISSHPFVKYWCHFNAYIGSSPLSDYFDFPYVGHVKNPKEMTQLFTELIKYEKSVEAFAPIKAQALLMQIIHTYFVDICDSNVTMKKNLSENKIFKLLDYIETHLHSKITVKQLASYVNLDPSYMIRLFKSHFGSSPIDYINRQKIERAKVLLMMSNDTIKSIAEKLGFTTPYYFSSVFKKHSGISPKYYRQSQNL